MKGLVRLGLLVLLLACRPVPPDPVSPVPLAPLRDALLRAWRV